MDLKELTLAVSGKSSVEPPIVQKVLETAFEILGAELAKNEKVEIQGLGTFVRRQSRKSGKEGKTLFRSWSAKRTKGNTRKAVNGRKKTKKKTPKRKTEKSP